MAPELFHTMEANELQELARKVQEYQTAKSLSDSALVRKFPDLGSAKTYKRILNKDLAELDLERQLNNYRAVWAVIESDPADEAEEDELFDDLWACTQLRKVFFDTSRVTGNGRVIFLLGPTGAGKTSARRALLSKYGSRLLLVEADVSWNDRPGAMLGAILKALGRQDRPTGMAEAMDKVVELLNASRRGLVVEEAHHLGPRLMNLVKSLVNKTPGEFVLIAIDTLWRKLETAAYEEARQLTGNRLAERINLGREVRESDVKKVLERRVTWANGDSKEALRVVLDKANNHGRLAFVSDVCVRANKKAEGEPVTLDQWIDSMREEVASR